MTGLLCACGQSESLIGASRADRNDVDETPRPAGVRHRLFADDVPTHSLPLTISLETIGDESTPLIARGTALPVTHRQVFSTGEDDQQLVTLHVVQGERRNASENRRVGTFQMSGIARAPRGMTQIEVTFAVDSNGVLTVSSRDNATGQANAVKLDSAGGTLDQATIDYLLVDVRAEEAALLEREWHQAKSDLQQLIDASKAVVAAWPSMPKQLRVKVEREIAAAQAFVKLTKAAGGTALLRAVSESLRRTMHEVSTAAAQ